LVLLYDRKEILSKGPAQSLVRIDSPKFLRFGHQSGPQGKLNMIPMKVGGGGLCCVLNIAAIGIVVTVTIVREVAKARQETHSCLRGLLIWSPSIAAVLPATFVNAHSSGILH